MFFLGIADLVEEIYLFYALIMMFDLVGFGMCKCILNYFGDLMRYM